MSASLLDSLSSLVTPDLINKAASTYGESGAALGKGFGAVFPALLSGLANRAGDGNFASSLFSLASDPVSANALNDVGGLVGASSSSPVMSWGNKLLSLLFGNNTGGLASALAGFAGLKGSTGNSLLSLAAPLVLGVLGKQVRSGGLNASSLANLLLGQKSAFSAALPPALSNIGSYLGSPAAAASAATTAYAAPPVPESKSSIWRWLVPLLVVLAAIWLLSSLFGRKERPAEEPAQPAAVEPAPAPAPEAAPATEGTPAATVYFEVDQATPPTGTDAQLAPVVDYLKANSGSMAVISGYHDPTGDQAHNEELAKNRAGSVRDALVAAGIDASRIDMQKPVVTEGGGSMEEARRVEVTVR